MTTLLVVALAAPLVGAVLAAGGGRWAHASGALAPLVAAAGWAVLVAADPFELGRLLVTPTVAATGTGLALLAAAQPAGSAPARAAELSVVSVGALGAALAAGSDDAPARVLAVAVAVAVLLSVASTYLDGGGRRSVVSLLGVGAVVTTGLAIDDAAVSAAVVLAGTGLALLVAVRTMSSDGPVPSDGPVSSVSRMSPDGSVATTPRTPTTPTASTMSLGAALLPLLVFASSTRVVEVVGDTDLDVVAMVGSAGALVVAAGLIVRRTTASGTALPLAVVAAGVVLVAQGLPGAHGAGLLLVAGGLLALAADHPVGVVAALPGLTAGAVSFGAANDAVHAAAGAACLAVLVAGALELPARARFTVVGARDRWVLLAAAVAFGVLPAWGWADVSLPEHVEAVATGVAFALPGALLTAMVRRPWAETAAAQPAPVQPAPVRHAPVEPAPVEPAPVDPAPVQPASPPPARVEPERAARPVVVRSARPARAAARSRSEEGRMPPGTTRRPGRLPLRPAPAAEPTHGSPIPDIEREGPEVPLVEANLEGAPDDEETGRETQHPVATSPRPVPLRARRSGPPGRRRLRAGSGRPSR